ncbi:MAG: hypothetical protein WA908_00550 [Pontixanthobacter sp.]
MTAKFVLAALASTILVPSVPMAQTSSPAPASELTLEQQTGLRCAAAFAIVAQGQGIGNADALTYPPLAERGREFFVRYSAQMIDQTDLTREQIASLLRDEAQNLWDRQEIEPIMPACLTLLEASGL